MSCHELTIALSSQKEFVTKINISNRSSQIVLASIIAPVKLLFSTKMYGYFFLFLCKNICCDTEALLMCTHKICFPGEIRKIILI